MPKLELTAEQTLVLYDVLRTVYDNDIEIEDAAQSKALLTVFANVRKLIVESLRKQPSSTSFHDSFRRWETAQLKQIERLRADRCKAEQCTKASKHGGDANRCACQESHITSGNHNK